MMALDRLAHKSAKTYYTGIITLGEFSPQLLAYYIHTTNIL